MALDAADATRTEQAPQQRAAEPTTPTSSRSRGELPADVRIAEPSPEAATACIAEHHHPRSGDDTDHDHDACAESRTRMWVGGTLVKEGFPVAEISDLIDTDDAMIWLDLHQPEAADLQVLSEEFGLHPLAIEDATTQHQRPKLDRYSDHVFLNMYAVHLAEDGDVLETSELSAFVLPKALITVRKAGGLPVEKMLDRWDSAPELLPHGPGALVHGLIDLIVDGHFAAVHQMDDLVETLEERIFSDEPMQREDQRHSLALRKSLALLRRVVLPMREVVSSLLRRELGIVDEELTPYYQDVYDHVLRVTEWTESLRDLVTTIRETNLTLQGNRLNEIMKKLTSWAAIIAVPTAVTGFFGQNVPYPGFGHADGFWASVAIMLAIGVGLFVAFKRREWL